MQQSQDPHAHQPVLRAGTAIFNARLVAILLHGRGASAEDILGLSREFSASDVTYLAPQAAGRTWYPDSFLAPIEQNEPGISSGLRVIAGLLQDLYQQDVSSDRVVLLGFSQGACLALEFAARHARRYAAVVALSGGLIGPPGTPRNYPGRDEVTVQAGDDGIRFLPVSGRPLEEPVAWYGPIVMNTQEQLQQAFSELYIVTTAPTGRAHECTSYRRPSHQNNMFSPILLHVLMSAQLTAPGLPRARPRL